MAQENETDDNAIYEVLKSIDASLKELVKRSRAKAGKPVADDRDLDGRYGDFVVKLSPRDWAGEDYKGRPLSQTSSAFLDQLAEMYAFFAEKNEKSGATLDNGKPKAEYDRLSEARCRGWAKRLRAGWKPPVTAPSTFGKHPAASSDFGADPFAGKTNGFGQSHFEDDDSQM